MDGKTTDLSGLGCDITQWQEYEMEVRNRQATVRINGKQVLTARYTQNMGMISGLGFTSNGGIEVDYAHLKGLDGTVVVSDDFNE
jgi:hypothetical protein